MAEDKSSVSHKRPSVVVAEPAQRGEWSQMALGTCAHACTTFAAISDGVACSNVAGEPTRVSSEGGCSKVVQEDDIFFCDLLPNMNVRAVAVKQLRKQWAGHEKPPQVNVMAESRGNNG